MIFFIFLQFYVQETDSIYKAIKFSNEKELHIEVGLNYFDFKMGKLTDLKQSKQSKVKEVKLADIKMKYDLTSFSGDVEYENNKGIGRVAVKGNKNKEREQWVGKTSINTCSLLVTNRLPLYLDMELEMCGSVIDLSGLKLAQLNLSTSGNTTVRFNSPNPIMCKNMYISALISKFKGEFLGNAGFDVFYFRGGVSSSTLDLRGEIKGSKRVEVMMGVGSLKLILPKEVGIRLKPTGISLKSIAGLIKVAEGWYQSSNWGTTDRELIIHIDGSSMGILRVETL